MNDWAEGRRKAIVAGIVIVVLALLGSLSFKLFYQAPSCFDHKQNGAETGVDCGGPCPYLCTVDEQAVSVQFARALVQQPGRIDVVAYINNPNAAAAHNAEFAINLYNQNNQLVATKVGLVDIPPSTTVPLYIPDFYDGTVPGAQAFLTINPASLFWYRLPGKPVVPSVVNYTTQNLTTNPSVTATLQNPAPVALRNQKVYIVAFDAAGNVVGASQTFLQSIPAQSAATATFTWNKAFPFAPARFEITPVVSLSGS